MVSYFLEACCIVLPLQWPEGSPGAGAKGDTASRRAHMAVVTAYSLFRCFAVVVGKRDSPEAAGRDDSSQDLLSPV